MVLAIITIFIPGTTGADHIFLSQANNLVVGYPNAECRQLSSSITTESP